MLSESWRQGIVIVVLPPGFWSRSHTFFSPASPTFRDRPLLPFIIYCELAFFDQHPVDPGCGSEFDFLCLSSVFVTLNYAKKDYYFYPSPGTWAYHSSQEHANGVEPVKLLSIQWTCDIKRMSRFGKAKTRNIDGKCFLFC